MSKPSQPSLARRTLFAGAGTAGALAAAATLLPGTTAERPVVAIEPALEGGEDGRYRATVHCPIGMCRPRVCPEESA